MYSKDLYTSTQSLVFSSHEFLIVVVYCCFFSIFIVVAAVDNKHNSRAVEIKAENVADMVLECIVRE